EPAARDEQQGEAGADFPVVDADRTSLVERHGASPFSAGGRYSLNAFTRSSGSSRAAGMSRLYDTSPPWRQVRGPRRVPSWRATSDPRDTRRCETPMAEFRPRYVTFDCYGTLTHFQMTSLTGTLFSDRVAPDRMQAFTTDFSAYRFDEVLGAWKPYAEVIE